MISLIYIMFAKKFIGFKLFLIFIFIRHCCTRRSFLQFFKWSLHQWRFFFFSSSFPKLKVPFNSWDDFLKWVLFCFCKGFDWWIKIESFWVSFDEGIRLLDKRMSKEDKRNGGDLLGTMKWRAPNKAWRKPYSHWLPGIQEDYHGPRSHKSRHH